MDAAELIRPAALRPGDRVAVVAPSGKVDPDRLAAGAAILEGLGFRVALPAPGRSHRYFAACDVDRRRQLLDAFADPDVRAVWCARGGYGVARILPEIDPAWMRRHAKLCIGFSDATALLQFLVRNVGVAALHGPMVAHDLVAQREAGTLEHLLALAAGASDWRIPVPRAVVAGSATGPLLGGCLTVLASLAGTPFAPRFAGAVALFEDTNERPLRRIDRMLVQLRQAGMLDGVRGFVFGTMPDCGEADDLCDTILDCLGDLDVPIGFGAPVGHGPVHYGVPLGVAVRLRVGRPDGTPTSMDEGELCGLEPLVE
ncbi:MAG: LD-carboxypeptidase [Thermodesulfobacteriota bacterium]